MSTCLISQNNFCFDSIQIKDIRRKVDNGIIYKQICDSLTGEAKIQRRMYKNLQMDLDLEKEQNVDCRLQNDLYKANEGLYQQENVLLLDEVKNQKKQKVIFGGSAVLILLIAILK